MVLNPEEATAQWGASQINQPSWGCTKDATMQGDTEWGPAVGEGHGSWVLNIK